MRQTTFLACWRLASLILFSVLLVALALPSAAATAQANDRFASLLEQQMPELLQRFGVPGSVVARISDGDVAWTKAYGLADVATAAPMRPDMVFEFGSNGKVITAWAVMRLVEQGKVDLDAPANRYLKRWQIQSEDFDAGEVTVRRLLTHSSGLSIHGYLDNSPRRVSLPSLEQAVAGLHPLEGLVEWLESGHPSLGRLELVQQPGSGYKYSGGGYALLQMLIEDVSGETFDDFVQREITDPLGAHPTGASSLRWVWTPELEANSPTPYGNEGQPLEHRQLAIHGIGSEIGTVADFARFIAATVAGPDGEPPGRGVLTPATIRLMITPDGENGRQHGLAYGTGAINGNRTVSHSGANTGWMAYFILDTVRREGFVVATPSSRATNFHLTLLNLWLDAVYGPGPRTDWQPDPPLSLMALLPLAIAAILAVALALVVVRFVYQVRKGRRQRMSRPSARGLLFTLPWLLWLLLSWYVAYSPLPLILPASFPDLWPTPGSQALMVVLAGWVTYSFVAAFFVRQPATIQRTARSVVQPPSADSALSPL